VRGGNQRGGEKKDKENHRGNKGNKQAAGKSNARKMRIIGITKALSHKTTQRRKKLATN
jgi:hypothetical protein